MKDYIRRSLFDELDKRLQGEPNLIQVVIGPRQVGKTTLVLQLYKKWSGPKHYKTADLPNTPTIDWITTQWEEARVLYRKKRNKTLLILDEVQKIPRWSEVVKQLFDEDKRTKRPIRVILLGSSSLLMQKGLTESLAGRFEIHRHTHWSFSECEEYFKMKINEYLYFGGYPGAIPLRNDESRWSKYIRDSLIETVLSKDVLLMSTITKPALLRQLLGVGLAHPAEIISYQKMLGQLQDAGNTTTIASYLKLLSNAFLLSPLEKYSGSRIKQRGSTPKILAWDNSLVTATRGISYKVALKDKALMGRLTENAIGVKLLAITQETGGELFYWRDRDNEVDYVIQSGDRLIAIEVKSGSSPALLASLELFGRRYKRTKKTVILQTNNKIRDAGDIQYITIADFFRNPRKNIML
ncbi:MAG: hypothetical protein COY53_05455 [Elusimicrobia bacterium CG_4_10_14_0_8_um_filter_37_32]|nr:MAG: hypothetical protein COY53_05455 [Elusimicrobia bacterium CG_4_10_14_0_8_um_filter_37_32]